ncbi:VOC family protein [Hyphomicrobium sp. CS1GBMeth3]|uniref:VOC family protein n=1 Tax=Hyphomicrobium sp. CS1GBMeth3 TaxID=1892845 RepID=UPI00093158F4|nr:VOC family protein [Hyphomicrobium sp. CS1GBMeth3]
MTDNFTGSRLISCLGYKDADAALEWLVRAFGFEARAVYRNEAGKVVHAELTFVNGMIMLGPDGGGEFGKMVMTLPERAGGRCTQSIYVIVDNVDSHFARASAAGAETVIAPRGESYGGCSYSVRDPEGHTWSFGSYDPWAHPPIG